MNLPADDGSGSGADGAGPDDGGAHDVSADDVSAADTGAGDTGAGDTGAGDTNINARRAAKRKMLDEVFGDVLPTVTRDERDDGSDRAGTDRDQWYRDNQPPHHG